MPHEPPPLLRTPRTAKVAKNAKYTTFEREVAQNRSLSGVDPQSEATVHRANCRSGKHGPKPLETKAETPKERIRTPQGDQILPF